MGEAEITLYDLKAYGHELIEDLVALGMKKDRCYSYIATRLGIRIKDAHFHTMSTMAQARRAIEVLEKLKKKKILAKSKKPQAPKPKPVESVVSNRAIEKQLEAERMTIYKGYIDDIIDRVNRQNEFRRKHKFLVRIFPFIVRFM